MLFAKLETPYFSTEKLPFRSVIMFLGTEEKEKIINYKFLYGKEILLKGNHRSNPDNFFITNNLSKVK